jgi:hypothetical protein
MPFVTEDGDHAGRVDPKGKSGRHALSFSWLELLVSALITVGICTIVFVTWIKPIHDHQRWFFRVEGSIKSLASRRPPGVNHEQWEQAVRWTLHAHRNCCVVREFLKTRERVGLQRFADELDLRVRGPVDLKIIDWVWDEIERISKYGKKYSDDWRPGRGIRQPTFAID